DDKKALAFVHSLNGYAVKSLDLATERITPTQLAEIAGKLGCTVEQLLDQTYIEQVKGKTNTRSNILSLTGEDLLQFMVANTRLVRTPLVITGKTAFIYESAYDLVKRGMAHKDNTLSNANVEEKKTGR